MSPEAKKDRIISAVEQIALKGSGRRPLILAIEDLHWIDKSSEDFFKVLLGSISGSRIFLIFTYRPEFVHTWGGKSYHNQLNLNRLSNRESLFMVSHILGSENIDREIEELVLEKTEGVPFFIEEFVKSLRDLQVIEEEKKKYYLVKEGKGIVIPSTIHDVIMARVDLLPDAAKELLQTGSVIEREFSYELIKLVLRLPAKELMSRLAVLKDTELLYERGIYPQSTYIFKHALTQEVVYDSILSPKKKELHEIIGSNIVELYEANIDEYYSVIATHFIKSDNYEKGSEYSKKAAQKAFKASSSKDAIEYAKKRIFCLEKLPQKDQDPKRLIEARTILGMYYMALGYHVEAKEAVDPVFTLAIESNYNKRLSQIYTIMGSYYCFVKEDFFQAFKHFKHALKISKKINDFISSVYCNQFLGFARAYNGEFEKSLYAFEQALNISTAANNLYGISIAKSFMNFHVYNYRGNVIKGLQTSSESVEVAEKSGDTFSKLCAYISHGISFYNIGKFETASKFFLKGADISKRNNIFLWNAVAHTWLGKIFFENKDYQKAISYNDKAVQLLQENSLMPSWVNVQKINAVRAKVMNREQVGHLEKLYGYVSLNKIKVFQGWMMRYIAEILLNIDNQHISEAESWIKKAINVDKINGAAINLPKDYRLYADLFKRKNDLPKAREKLNKAINIFRECGADGWVEKYERELAVM